MSFKFRYSLDNFRGLAIIFVMVSHLGSFREMGKVGEYAYFIVGNATAWFVFISGYLFYHIEKNHFSYRNYLAKKAKYVILPYLILSVPAILLGIYFSRSALHGLTPFSYAAWSLAVGGAVIGPMWFIPMIVVFFVFTPFFNYVSKSRMIYPLAIIGIGFSVFSSRPVGGTNALLSFTHFLGFYVLGLVFAANAAFIDAIRASVKWIIVVAGLGLFIIIGTLYGDRPQAPVGFYDGMGEFNILQFGKLVLLIAMFFLFEMFLSQKNEILGYLAKISFGLFFVHGFYIALFSRISPYLDGSAALAKFLCEFLVVILVSIVTVFAVQRTLKKGSRYVIGC